jgi:uncharacterized protein (TIGR03000 family)
MFRHFASLLPTAVLATGTLLLAGGPAQAQHGGHGGGHGGGHAGGGHAGAFHGGAYHGGYYHGGYYHGGNGFHPYYGGFHGPFYGAGLYRPYYGFGLGLGLGLGLGYGLGGGFGYGGYAPYYGAGYGAAVPPAVVYAPGAYGNGYGAAPGAALPPPNGQTQSPPAPDNAAHLQLIVPDNAEVWFDGARTSQTGKVREFTSPTLTPGSNYTYKISVRYIDAKGQPVNDTRNIHVRPNDWFSIDFTRPEPPNPPTAPPNPMPPIVNQ